MPPLPNFPGLGANKPRNKPTNALLLLHKPPKPGTLPDYPFEPDVEDVARPTTTQINQSGPKSPSSLYVNLTGIDDTVQRAFGLQTANGKPWIWEPSRGRWFLAWVFAEGEMNGPQKLYVGDREYTVGGSGNIRAVAGGQLYLGDAAQDVYAWFNANMDVTYPVGTTHAGMVVFGKVFALSELQGQPALRLYGTWRNELYDPRDMRSIQANGVATTSDRFQVTDHANLNPTTAITIEAWGRVDPGQSSEVRRLFYKRSGATGYDLQLQNGALVEPRSVLYVNTANPAARVVTAPTGSFDATDGEPMHVAMTYGSGAGPRMRLFINGEMVTELTWAVSGGDDALIVTNAVNLQLNYNGTNWGMREGRIWNTERTPAQIRDNFRKHLVGNETGLVANWPVDDAASATTVLDKTANNHDAAKVGTNVTVDAEYLVGLAPASWAARGYYNQPSLVAGRIAEDRAPSSINPNWHDIAVVADHTDSDITGNPGVKRHTFNGVFDQEADWLEQVRVAGGLGGFVFWLEGNQLRMRPDWLVPTADYAITDSMIVTDSVQWVNGDPPFDEVPDAVAVTYYDTAAQEERTAYSVDPLTGNERFIDYRNAFSITTWDEAERHAISVHNRYLKEIFVLDMEVSDEGLKVQPWDRVDVTYGPLGLVAFPMRVHARKITGPKTYRLRLKTYDATAYDESVNTAPALNPTTRVPVGDIPTGPVPTLVEIFEYVRPLTLRVKIQLDDPEWVHTKHIKLEFWNAAETEMIIAPLLFTLAQFTEIAAGPPASLEVRVGLESDDYKVRTRIVNTLGEEGAPSAFLARTFAAGMDDPNAPPTPTGLTITPRSEPAVGSADLQMLCEWDAITYNVAHALRCLIINNDLNAPVPATTRAIGLDPADTSYVWTGLPSNTNMTVSLQVQSYTGALSTAATAVAKTLHAKAMAHWKFESGGTQDDDEVGGYTLQTNGSWQSMVGQVGDGYRQSNLFGGVKYTEEAPADIEDSWTMLGWVQVYTSPPNGSHGNIWSRYSSLGGSEDVLWRLYYKDSTRDLYLEIAAAPDITTLVTWDVGASLAAATWQFLALRYAHGTWSIILNNNATLLFTEQLATAFDLNALCNGAFTSDNARSAFDEVRLYHAALTRDEIIAIYDAEKTP